MGSKKTVNKGKIVKTAAFLTFLLGILLVLGEVLHYAELADLLSDPEDINIASRSGLVNSILINLEILIVIFLIFKLTRKLLISRFVTVVFGIAIFLWLVISFSTMSDIDPYRAVYIDSWNTSWLGLLPHILFIVSFISAYFLLSKAIKRRKEENLTLMDDENFIAVNIIGFLGGICGLVVTFAFSQYEFSLYAWKNIILPVCLILLVPYGSIMIYRFTGSPGKNSSDIFDEKQRYDISRAGITTWLLSIPCMLIMFLFYYFNMFEFESILWFPYYLFMTLLIFSASTMYYFKRG